MSEQNLNLIDVFKGARLQRDYLYEVWLPPLPNISFSEVELVKYCQDVKFGTYNIGELSSIRYGALERNYAGFFNIEKVNLTYIKAIPDLVYTYFSAWRSLIIDEDGFYFPKINYAKTVYIRLMDVTGTEVEKYKLTGAFPTIYPSYDLSYKSEKVVEYQVSLSVDNVVKV